MRKDVSTSQRLYATCPRGMRRPRVLSCIIWRVDVRYARSAAKHRIGRAAIRYVMTTTDPMETTTKTGEPGWLYVGRDERGRRLEVMAVEISAARGRPPYLLVIHAMQQQRGS